MKIVVFATGFLVPFGDSTWYLDQCQRSRAPFVSLSDFIFSSSNTRVDVVPGECQSFVIKFLTALLIIPCPSVHSANTTRC